MIGIGKDKWPGDDGKRNEVGTGRTLPILYSQQESRAPSKRTEDESLLGYSAV
jgi:hypothetical protein